MTPKKKMNTNLTTTWNREDRDLLIELRTEMKGVRNDLQNIVDGNNARLSLLEQGKLDRTEANRIQSETLAVQSDHEIRLRTVEDDTKGHQTQIKTLLAVGAGMFAVFQVVVQVALNYLKH